MGAWSHEEDELLLRLYQKERKLISEIAEELNRSQDATRNRLYILRGAGKHGKKITANVHLSVVEFEEMRAARQEVKSARIAVEKVKATEQGLAAFIAVGKRLINARTNKRITAPIFEELQKLIVEYEK